MWWERWEQLETHRRIRRTCTFRFRSSILTSDGGEEPRWTHFWSGAIPPLSSADLQVGLPLFLSETIEVPVAAGRVARPVVAGAIFACRKRAAGRRRTGEDVVLVERLAIFAEITGPFDGRVLFGERRRLRQIAPELRKFHRIAVQVCEIAR